MADFYADQNISLDLIALLRGRGHTAITARDLGLERARDDEHLLVAAERGRMLLTYNRDDFELLHDAWRRWSRAWQVTAAHAGILIAPHPPHRSVAEAAREIDSLLASGYPLANELYRWRPVGGWVRRP